MVSFWWFCFVDEVILRFEFQQLRLFRFCGLFHLIELMFSVLEVDMVNVFEPKSTQSLLHTILSLACVKNKGFNFNEVG